MRTFVVLFFAAIPLIACDDPKVAQRHPAEEAKPACRNDLKVKLPSPDERARGEYESGRRMEERGDAAAAVKAYAFAASVGSADAAHRLSQIYEEGALGVRRDREEALNWRKLADVLGKNDPSQAAKGDKVALACSGPRS